MRAYIEEMLSSGQMQVVAREVDPEHELAAVVAKAQQESRRPILFEDVKGSELPVVSNIYGDRDRLGEMIGDKGRSFCQQWANLMKAGGGELVTVAEAAGEFYSAKISDLPHITYHEKDAGPYITSGIFLANDVDTGVPNLSFHRGMHISDDEIRIRLGTTHDLTKYQARAEEAGEALEVAVLIGPPPVVALAAASPIPSDESEMALVAQLTDGPFRMRPCRHIDIDVPYDTEVVIEGRILPDVRRPEGPFGEFAGYYVDVADNHVLEVLGVTVRKNAYYHALICGSPEDHRLLELALSNRVYAHLNNTIPGILDVACVPNLFNTVVKIDKQYEGQPEQVILGAHGVHHDFVKSVMVVDDDVDMNDLDDVYWAFLTRGPADTRVKTFSGVPGFYRGNKPQNWGRVGFDCTAPLDGRPAVERKRIRGLDSLKLSDYLT